jgi:hypothetical protein
LKHKIFWKICCDAVLLIDSTSPVGYPIQYAKSLSNITSSPHHQDLRGNQLHQTINIHNPLLAKYILTFLGATSPPNLTNIFLNNLVGFGRYSFSAESYEVAVAKNNAQVVHSGQPAQLFGLRPI